MIKRIIINVYISHAHLSCQFYTYTHALIKYPPNFEISVLVEN